MIQLKLPLPNSANTHWRHGRGITYLSAQGRAYRQAVADHLKTLTFGALRSRLEVTILLYPRDKRKIDIDNRVKPLLDALQKGGLFVDDEQIDKLIVERKEIVKGGQCIVHIKEHEKP